ncbi:single-strand binding protein [Geothermobacter ehrlichii]|uniref:Single-stranded DNA-binding protein n=1 Tax=Geothermobacter ehrlichii TaxID=213224 RepID=A0A5D3WHN9_9BACT|nr:single-stranded DNA-binding protein [Geothermobacter ehrlichii]TYO96739.1 single-strand binding protein [Geothermobacter ehrlichii]
MYNKVTLVGRIGREPEYRATKQGAGVLSFPLATWERYRKEDGEYAEKTEWHQIVAWEPLANNFLLYLTQRGDEPKGKGLLVLVEGSIRHRRYQDKDGNTRYVTEIRADEIKALPSQKNGDSNRAEDSDIPF